MNKKNNLRTFKTVFIFILSFCVGLYLLFWYLGKYELIRYEYERSKTGYDWGRIVMLLLSDHKVVNNRLVIYGSPYKLLIVIDTGTENEGKASISNLKLINEDGTIIFDDDGLYALNLEDDYDGSAHYKSAYFKWKNVEIEHRNYTVVFDLHIKTNKLEVNEKIEIPLKKIYKKEQKNKFIDSVKGV